MQFWGRSPNFFRFSTQVFFSQNSSSKFSLKTHGFRQFILPGCCNNRNTKHNPGFTYVASMMSCPNVKKISLWVLYLSVFASAMSQSSVSANCRSFIITGGCLWQLGNFTLSFTSSLMTASTATWSGPEFQDSIPINIADLPRPYSWCRNIFLLGPGPSTHKVSLTSH